MYRSVFIISCCCSNFCSCCSSVLPKVVSAASSILSLRLCFCCCVLDFCYSSSKYVWSLLCVLHYVFYSILLSGASALCLNVSSGSSAPLLLLQHQQEKGEFPVLELSPSGRRRARLLTRSHFPPPVRNGFKHLARLSSCSRRPLLSWKSCLPLLVLFQASGVGL